VDHGSGEEGEDGGDASHKLAAEGALSLLVDSGQDINARSGIRMRAPLHVATEAGAVDVVELLLNAGAVVDICDVEGCTPLHVAAELATPAHQAIVLADAGAAVNATSSTRKTPAHLAATGGPHLALPRNGLLFAAVGGGGGAAASRSGGEGGAGVPESKASDHGAHPPSPSGAGAGATGGGSMASGAEERSEDDGVGDRAGAGEGVPDGGSAMITLLARLGANLDAIDAEQNTPLLLAAKRGNYLAVETLLTLGARIYAQNIRGHTALHIAAFHHHIPVVRLLCRWDAEVGRLQHVLDRSGRSAYDLAADPPTRDALHTLFEACASGKLDLAQSVAKAGASVPMVAVASWLPVRPFEVTRLLRRSCLHVTITGAARALAIARAGSAKGGKPVPAAHAPPSRVRTNPSAVHIVAGVGFRMTPHPTPPKVGLPLPGKAAWGGSPADMLLAFRDADDAEASLYADPCAFIAPAEAAPKRTTATAAAGGAGTSVLSGGVSLAERRTVPGSELTSPQTEKEYGRVVDYLLRAGCDPNSADIDGVTPLMLAVRYGLLFITRKLCTKGADVAAVDRRGNNALHWAYAFAHPIAAGIVEEFAGEEALAATNADGLKPHGAAAAGMRILPYSTERLVTVRPPHPRSATLVVTKLG